MSSGPVGFGTGEQGYGPVGVDIPAPLENGEDQLVNDIHAMRQRICDNPTLQRIPCQFTAAYAGSKQDMTGLEINSVIITVTSGVIYGFLSDQSSNFLKTVSPLPDWVVSAGVVPTTQQFMFPVGRNYILTFQEGNNSTANGSVMAAKV